MDIRHNLHRIRRKDGKRWIGSARFSIVVTSVVVATMTFAAATGAVDAVPFGKGIDVLTFHIQRMTTLEDALHKAVNDRDSKQLDKMLSPFFEIRRAGGVVVQRDAWLREGMKSGGQLYELRMTCRTASLPFSPWPRLDTRTGSSSTSECTNRTNGVCAFASRRPKPSDEPVENQLPVR